MVPVFGAIPRAISRAFASSLMFALNVIAVKLQLWSPGALSEIVVS